MCYRWLDPLSCHSFPCQATPTTTKLRSRICANVLRHGHKASCWVDKMSRLPYTSLHPLNLMLVMFWLVFSSRLDFPLLSDAQSLSHISLKVNAEFIHLRCLTWSDLRKVCSKHQLAMTPTVTTRKLYSSEACWDKLHCSLFSNKINRQTMKMSLAWRCFRFYFLFFLRDTLV